MRFNYNTKISMFNKGGYEAYAALKCKPSRILLTECCNS